MTDQRSDPDHRDSGRTALLIPRRRPRIAGPAQSVAEVLTPIVASRPDAIALVGRHGRYTYAELDTEVGRAAAALTKCGIAPGDRVAVCLPNDVDAVIAFLAIMR